MNTRLPNLPETKSTAKVRTLVVDDSPCMLSILTQILDEAGHIDLVGTATDGCQALRYVSFLSPGLVLMDIQMPRMNGIQATRCIKQREHPPLVIIVSSDDSPITKAAAEAAGADGFVIKQGNLRHQLLGAIQDLFGLKGAIPAIPNDAMDENRRPPNKTSEKKLDNFGTHERLDPALDAVEIQATRPDNTTSPPGTLSFGSAQRLQTRCPHRIQHTVGCSFRQPVAVTRQTFAQLCASSRIQPARKASDNTQKPMKTRKVQGNTGQHKAKTTPHPSPAVEEIRKRAHEIFITRGATPGNELDDWLRAEQELKQGRAGTKTENP